MNSGRKGLSGRIAFGFGERISFRRESRCGRSARQSIRGGQGGIDRHELGAADHAARRACWCVQIAICAVLVTSSLVAVRGLVRSLHSNFGFEPRNAMLVDTDLRMAGYSGDQTARDAKAHDRGDGDDSRREIGGIGQVTRP